MRKIYRQCSQGHFTLPSIAEKEVDMDEIEQTSSLVVKKESLKVVRRINYVNPFTVLKKGWP